MTEPALFSVTAADRALRAVDDLRRGPATQLQPLGVLVNRYRDRSPEHRYRVTELNDMFGPLVLAPMIPERSALQQAQGASQPVHRWPGNAGQELAAAFDSHLSRVLRLASRRGAPPPRPERRPEGAARPQPVARARRRRASSSAPVVRAGSLAVCSPGSSARLHSTSRQTRPTAIPNTP